MSSFSVFCFFFSIFLKVCKHESVLGTSVHKFPMENLLFCYVMSSHFGTCLIFISKNILVSGYVHNEET